MAVAMTGATILTRLRSAADDGGEADGDEQRERRRAERPLPEDVEGEAADEGPGEAGLEAAGDGPDDTEDQDRMKDGVADLQIRDDGELCERGHHGKRRGDDELHVGVRSSADEPTVGRKADGDRDDG